MREKFKVGDKVRLKGDWRTYEVREVYIDGFIRAVEITTNYDKIGLFRDSSLFDKAE